MKVNQGTFRKVVMLVAIFSSSVAGCVSTDKWGPEITEALENQCTGQFMEMGAPPVIAGSVCKCLIAKQQSLFPESVCMQAPQTLNICIQATTLFVEECMAKEKAKTPKAPRERARPSPVEEKRDLGKVI